MWPRNPLVLSLTIPRSCQPNRHTDWPSTNEALVQRWYLVRIQHHLLGCTIYSISVMMKCCFVYNRKNTWVKGYMSGNGIGFSDCHSQWPTWEICTFSLHHTGISVFRIPGFQEGTIPAKDTVKVLLNFRLLFSSRAFCVKWQAKRESPSCPE